MNTYTVRLNIPVVMWALVEVEATCEADAIKQAYELNRDGTISYESAGMNHLDATVTQVEVNA